MNQINILLANSIFLITILIILVLLLKANGHSEPKMREDIQKIKAQISHLEAESESL